MTQWSKSFEKVADMIGGEHVTYASADALGDVADRMHWEDVGDFHRAFKCAGQVLDVVEDGNGVPVAWRMYWQDEDVEWPNADTRETWHVCDGQDDALYAVESVGGRAWDGTAAERWWKYSQVWA